MIEFLVDNIYVRFGGQLFRRTVGIHMRTNFTPLLADLFLYSYENEFLDKLIKEGKRKLARNFNLSHRYTGCLKKFARIQRTQNSFSRYIYLMHRVLAHVHLMHDFLFLII